MNLKKCENGHYYDSDKFSSCPHCDHHLFAKDKTSDRTRMLGIDGPPDNRDIYLSRRYLRGCINKNYDIIIIIVSEIGEYEKSVYLTVKGGEDADDVLQKLRERGHLSFDREYSFANWPKVSPDWGNEYISQSKYVCELCEECRPFQFMALLRYVRKKIQIPLPQNTVNKNFGQIGDTFDVLDENGEERECEVLFTFSAEETGKSYVVYTDNTVDEEENLKVYASIFDPDAYRKELIPIESDREWEIIETILEEIQELAQEEEDKKTHMNAKENDLVFFTAVKTEDIFQGKYCSGDEELYKSLKEQNKAYSFPDKDRILLGRDTRRCDLVFDSVYVARIHAEIIFKDGLGYLHNMHSMNGIYFMQKGSFVRLEKDQYAGPLKAGMVFSLGQGASQEKRKKIVVVSRKIFEFSGESYFLGHENYTIYDLGDNYKIIIDNKENMGKLHYHEFIVPQEAIMPLKEIVDNLDWKELYDSECAVPLDGYHWSIKTPHMKSSGYEVYPDDFREVKENIIRELEILRLKYADCQNNHPISTVFPRKANP